MEAVRVELLLAGGTFDQFVTELLANQ